MLERLDPRPILKGVVSGLRRRSSHAVEKPDWAARIILFGIPALTAALLIYHQTVIDAAEVVLAGAAILVGALLAGFSQIATWRERVLARGRKVDRIRVRALNEAGALVLMSVHVSVVASVGVFVLAVMDLDHLIGFEKGVAVVLSAIAPASLAYVAISLVFVANLLWDGFENEQEDVRRDGLEDFEP